MRRVNYNHTNYLINLINNNINKIIIEIIILSYDDEISLITIIIKKSDDIIDIRPLFFYTVYPLL